MKGKGIIKKMICPSCGDEMFHHKRSESILPRFDCYHSTRSMKSVFIDEFRCNHCVYIFSFEWLNKFKTHERFVLRSGEDKEVWKKLYRWFDETVAVWKRRIDKDAAV